MKKIQLTTKILEHIRRSRKEQNLTQQDLAKKLEITFQKYQRIESGTTKNIDYSTFLKILNTLDIAQEQVLTLEKLPKSYRFSPQILKRVQIIQTENNLDSEREAIEFCLNDYFKNLDLANIQYEIQDIFTTALEVQYTKMINNLLNNLLIDEIMAKNLGLSSSDAKEIKDKITNILTSRIRAKSY